MKITAIEGSPRPQGHSSELLNQVLKGCREKAQHQEADVEINHLRPFDMDIEPCTGCFSCSETGTCIFSDDMDPLIDEGGFDQSDIILLSTPIYFNGHPSHVKKMIDRCQPIYASKYDLKKPIIDRDKFRLSAWLACAGGPSYEDQFTAARIVAEMFFKTVNTEKFDEIVRPNTDEETPADSPGLKNSSRKLGISLVERFLS
ncbi:flavodoxin family protein [Halarsenatibacter silvermanii]|uniref:NADPH-dependent FMN reductase n=1 Tax=Halarsenatibacter silvermanii TaxID=321763 RepID=A0A1G9I8C8_9FIRM|nr:flavodoxin family protein [Halarsenatibacter silvermanii]SDL21084.1 NADPH-dependent FMN reductase [Halarsenatibacter silvermanii]